MSRHHSRIALASTGRLFVHKINDWGGSVIIRRDRKTTKLVWGKDGSSALGLLFAWQRAGATESHKHNPQLKTYHTTAKRPKNYSALVLQTWLEHRVVLMGEKSHILTPPLGLHKVTITCFHSLIWWFFCFCFLQNIPNIFLDAGDLSNERFLSLELWVRIRCFCVYENLIRRYSAKLKGRAILILHICFSPFLFLVP